MDRLKHASACPLFAVLYLDLDCFKVVNDSLGHMIGDQLLIAIALVGRRVCALRYNCTFRGDEFTTYLIFKTEKTQNRLPTVSKKN